MDSRTEATKDKACLPVQCERDLEVARVKQWTLKMTPKKLDKRKRKRTPLSVQRKHSMRTGGVKATQI